MINFKEVCITGLLIALVIWFGLRYPGHSTRESELDNMVTPFYTFIPPSLADSFFISHWYPFGVGPFIWCGINVTLLGNVLLFFDKQETPIVGELFVGWFCEMLKNVRSILWDFWVGVVGFWNQEKLQISFVQRWSLSDGYCQDSIWIYMGRLGLSFEGDRGIILHGNYKYSNVVYIQNFVSMSTSIQLSTKSHTC